MSDTGNSPRVLITGIGVVSAIGCGGNEFWPALAKGESGVVAADLPPGLAAPVKGFEARRWIGGPGLRRMDRLSQMLVAAARMALVDAGLDLQRDMTPQQVSIVMGTALGNVSETATFLTQLARKGAASASPMLFSNLVMNSAASYAAMEFNVTGPSLTITEGDISGELAVALGYDLVASGAAEVVLAGGADELAAVLAAAYRDLGLLASEAAGTWPGPFDRDRSGAVLGEGAAVVVLEKADKARERGSPGLVEIAGYRQWSAPAPAHGWPTSAADVGAEIRATLEALPGHVDAVYTGASGARDRDGLEMEALERALGRERAAWVTSIKGATGEFGAAGAVTVAAATLSMTHGSIAPLCRLRNPPTLDRIRLPGRVAEPAELVHVLVSGLGRGGNGVGILLRRLVP